MERIPEALLRVTASIRGQVVASSASRERCLREASTVVGEGALSCEEEVSIRGRTKEGEYWRDIPQQPYPVWSFG